MNVLLAVVFLIILSGCATSSKGEHHLGWIISEKSGCVEKVEIKKLGLLYKSCF